MNIREGKTCEVLDVECKVVNVATKYVSAKRLDDKISITAPKSDFRLLTN